MSAPKVIVLIGVTLALVSAVMGGGHKNNSPEKTESKFDCRPASEVYKPRDMEELKDVLMTSLDNVVNVGGPSYRVVKIHSATGQRVVGDLTNIVADLSDRKGTTKHCQITLHSCVEPLLSECVCWGRSDENKFE